MANGSKSSKVRNGSQLSKERAERERARLYTVRAALQTSKERRRVRDNVIAAVGGGLIVIAALVAQTLYFSTGPGAPVPAPTVTQSPEPAGTEKPIPGLTPAPTPIETNLPQPSESAVPTPNPTPTS